MENIYHCSLFIDGCHFDLHKKLRKVELNYLRVLTIFMPTPFLPSDFTVNPGESQTSETALAFIHSLRLLDGQLKAPKVFCYTKTQRHCC